MNWIRKHYHWIIAVLAFVEMLIFGGILNSAGVFIIPITESMGITRGSYALAMMPYSIVCTVCTMLSGLVFQKLGYKRSLLLGLGITALSLLITASSQSLAAFCVSKILLGLGYGVCFTAGAVRIVRDWFFKHQGLVVGAVSMASGVGGSLMTLVLTSLIGSFGWRWANFFLAAAVGAIALCYLLLMKNRPEELGLKPYGFGVRSGKARVSPDSDVHWPGLTFGQWLRHPLLYLMASATLLSCMAIYLSHSVLIPHFQDQGLSPADAAAYQSIYMLVLAVAKLLCGAATDKIGAKPVSLFCLMCSVLGQFLLSDTIDPVLCCLGVCLCGIGLSMTSIMIPLLATSLFGYRGISGINSIVLAMSSLANIFSNPMANLVFDKYRTYTPVFWTASAVTGVMVVVYLFMFALAKREKTRLGNLD